MNVLCKLRAMSPYVTSRLAMTMLFLLGAGCALFYGDTNIAWFLVGSSAGSVFLAFGVPEGAQTAA